MSSAQKTAVHDGTHGNEVNKCLVKILLLLFPFEFSVFNQNNNNESFD